MEHMSATIQKEYPSLAEIVRQETDGGRRIVQFYLRVVEGERDGFELCHRLTAARRLDKIAPGLVAEFLLKHANAQCRHSMRGGRLPLVRRSPVKWIPPECRESAPRGPNVFRHRLAQLVREETDDGKAIVEFISGVMHGTLTGFKPCHRMEAAKELAGYITRDESTDPTKTARAEPAEVDGADSPRRSRADGNPSPRRHSREGGNPSHPHHDMIDEYDEPDAAIETSGENITRLELAQAPREIDYTAMDPADLIDPKTGYTPELDHPHPSSPWLKSCKKGCGYDDHNHAPRVRPPKKKIFETLSATERRLMDKGYDLGWHGTPPPYPP